MKRTKSLVGLDIGTSAVKAVEITMQGEPVITGFGFAELPSPDVLPDVIADLFRNNGFHSRQVVTSVSGKSVIVRYLTMFRMSPEDLQNAIRFEADKYIPFDVDEVVLDCQPFDVAGIGDLAPNEMRVLLVACKRAIIDDQMRMLAAAGLSPQIVDVDAFALGNAFELVLGRGQSDDARVTGLIDVGASKSNVNLMRGTTSLFTREIPTGGMAFTQAIASRLGLSPQDAERTKRSPGDSLDRVRQAVAPAMEDLAGEIRLSFEYFESQFDVGIDEVLVSGGGAKLLGFDAELGRLFDRPTSTWDPTGELPIASGSVDISTMREHVQELAVAVGLAARAGRK